MHIPVLIATLLLLIPAAVAGILHGLSELLQHTESLHAALEVARALLDEIAPLGLSLLWITAGILFLVLAAWLLMSQRSS